MRSARAWASATACSACRCCSARTWLPPSPAPRTTGSPASGSTASRACAPRSWCRSRIPDLAAAEIDRCAADRRFVQVLLPANGELPLGRRAHWPIYEAAERHGLPVGIHAGSAYRHPVTNVGWPSYYAEDYASHATSFQSQLLSLIAEGVFAKFPSLRVVLVESGFTWLPAFVWRLEKFWRGLRMEVPWVSRPPGEIVREHVRLTLQPIDAPDAATLARVVEQLGSDRLLLFSTDYPHWQFEGAAALPEGLAPGLARRILVDNAIETYPRLMEDGP